MKKLLVFALLLTAPVLKLAAQSETPAAMELSAEPPVTSASLLTQLYTGINANSLGGWDDYKNRELMIKLNSVKKPSEAAPLLADIEYNMKTNLLSEKWEALRLGWRSKVKDCKEKAELAALMKEFESNLKPEAFNESWAETRKQWLSNIDKYNK